MIPSDPQVAIVVERNGWYSRLKHWSEWDLMTLSFLQLFQSKKWVVPSEEPFNLF